MTSEVTSALLEKGRTPASVDSVLDIVVIPVVNVCPAVAMGGIVSAAIEVI